MPTPTGMAKAGDIVRGPDGKRLRVTERMGNDIIYSVKVVPIDGPLPLQHRSRGYFIITEFPYWLKHGYSFVNGG